MAEFIQLLAGCITNINQADAEGFKTEQIKIIILNMCIQELFKK